MHGLYTAIIDTVIKQRVTLSLALKVCSRLVEKYGVRIRVGDTVYYWHSLSERLVEASVEELRRLGLTRVKGQGAQGDSPS